MTMTLSRTWKVGLSSLPKYGKYQVKLLLLYLRLSMIAGIIMGECNLSVGLFSGHEAILRIVRSLESFNHFTVVGINVSVVCCIIYIP